MLCIFFVLPEPPDWDRSKKISVSQTSLNGIRISVDLKFFNDETQGAIKERGFIVSRSESKLLIFSMNILKLDNLNRKYIFWQRWIL